MLMKDERQTGVDGLAEFTTHQKLQPSIPIVYSEPDPKRLLHFPRIGRRCYRNHYFQLTLGQLERNVELSVT